MASRTEELIELDKTFLWHPFTSMKPWLNGNPLVIERAEGNWLIDTDGNRYLDGVSSLWVNVHGHNRPEINDAIRAQLDRMAHSTLLGLTHPTAAELAGRLVGIAPDGLSKVFYSDNGSTAVEIALKLAFQYWQILGHPEKRRFLHLEHSYHGDTLGAVAVGGIPLFHEVFGPLLIDTLSVPTPHPYRHPSGGTPEEICHLALRQLAETLEQHDDEIAAFIIEPLVQGAAGMIVHPPGYLSGAAQLCRAHDVLLIADEVATGFGRTGTMFACEQEGVTPDFLCLAKGLTGGYLPLAATLTKQPIYDVFLGSTADRRAFYHGHTFTGHPLGCAAALASLDLFDREGVLERLPGLERTLRGRLGRKLASHPVVGEIRQKGLMVGIELVADRAAGRPFPAADQVGALVCAAAREHGVILRPLGDVVVLMPPLSITPAEIDHLVGAVESALGDVAGSA
jgi:adenosylmethionine-8-amino-7-oxononanoate aminotransferase